VFSRSIGPTAGDGAKQDLLGIIDRFRPRSFGDGLDKATNHLSRKIGQPEPWIRRPTMPPPSYARAR
jgi:hypothetical protein